MSKKKSKMEVSVNRGLEDVKENRITSYNSVEEMVEAMNKRAKQRRKEHPVAEFFDDVKITLEKWFVDAPQDFCREVKWFVQRGSRGYSDRDIWSIDWWLAEMMPGAIRQLKSTKIGLPCDMFMPSDPVNKHGGHTKEAFKRASKRWNKKLDNMIYTFETAHKIQNMNFHYISSAEYNTKENKDLRKRLSGLEFMTIMTKKECRKYEQGWSDFQEHFFSLWD